MVLAIQLHPFKKKISRAAYVHDNMAVSTLYHDTFVGAISIRIYMYVSRVLSVSSLKGFLFGPLKGSHVQKLASMSQTLEVCGDLKALIRQRAPVWHDNYGSRRLMCTTIMVLGRLLRATIWPCLFCMCLLNYLYTGLPRFLGGSFLGPKHSSKPCLFFKLTLCLPRSETGRF